MKLTEHEQSTKLRRTFENQVSKSAFRQVDDELRICGKFAEITILDTGGVDVWIISPDRHPLGTKKLNNICRTVLDSLPEVEIHKLDGEAWFQTENLPESLFKVLGVKQRRRYSDEQKKLRVEHMKRVNAKKGRSSQDH